MQLYIIFLIIFGMSLNGLSQTLMNYDENVKDNGMPINEKDFTTNILDHWQSYKDLTDNVNAILYEKRESLNNILNQYTVNILDFTGFDIESMHTIHLDTSNYANRISMDILTMISCITGSNQLYQEATKKHGEILSECIADAHEEFQNLNVLNDFYEYTHNIQHQATIAQNTILIVMQVFNPVVQQNLVDSFLTDSMNGTQWQLETNVEPELQAMVTSIEIESRSILYRASQCSFNNWFIFLSESNRFRNSINQCILQFNQSL